MNFTKKIFFFLLLNTLNTEAESRPISCSVKGGFGGLKIACNVKQDNVKLEKVTLNRGRCKSPNKLYEEEKLRVEEFRRRYDYKGPLTEIYPYPIGKKYNFGDRFVIDAGPCNLIEYAIVINGVSWVWQMP